MTSRKAEKEKRREERLEWEREQQEQAKRRRLYSVVAGGILVVAAAAAIIVAVAAGGGGNGDGNKTDATGGTKLDVAAVDPPQQQTTDLFQAAEKAGCTLTNPPIEGRTHLDPDDPIPDYKTNPPASGNHDPVPATDGAYADAPNVKHLVHSLEHGRVEVQWRGISEKQISQLKGLFDEDPYHILLSPNETRMKGDVAVIAWGHVALCKKLTPEVFDVIRAFTTRYRDKGPEFVP